MGGTTRKLRKFNSMATVQQKKGNLSTKNTPGKPFCDTKSKNSQFSNSKQGEESKRQELSTFSNRVRTLRRSSSVEFIPEKRHSFGLSSEKIAVMDNFVTRNRIRRLGS